MTRIRAFETEDVPFLRRLGARVRLRGTAFVVQTAMGEDIGVLWAEIEPYVAQIGLVFQDEHQWLDGCAADALAVFRAALFRALPLQRIEALIPASANFMTDAYLAAGFAKEGVLRSALRYALAWDMMERPTFRSRRPTAGYSYSDAILVSAIAEG